MTLRKRLLSAVLVSASAALLTLGAPAASMAKPAPDAIHPKTPSQGPTRRLPLTGATVSRGFQVGESNWLPGHRGVDLAGRSGQTVVAAAAGTVRWVGVVDSVPGLSIQHGDGTITTYQPLTALVSPGEAVAVGTPIGALEPGHPGCASEACLHWGVRSGKKYLDPMLWLSGQTVQVRLLPVGSRPSRLSASRDGLDINLAHPLGPAPSTGRTGLKEGP